MMSLSCKYLFRPLGRAQFAMHPTICRLQQTRFSSDLFRTQVDTFGGVEIKGGFSELTPIEFEDKLNRSLINWKENKRRGVWLRLSINDAALIPVAVRHGFWFHHCRDDYILLCTWLVGDKTTSPLPRGPSHYIGVAGFVVNSRDELLMIKEKDGPAKARDLWKLPGGLLDKSENISAGVLREVEEETGLQCNFIRLSSMVESHHGTGPMRESSSDLYCISVLQAMDETQTIIPQAQEIEACEWIPISQALSFPLYAPGTVFGESFRAAFRVRNEFVKAGDKGDLGLLSETFPVGIGSRVANVLHTNNKQADVCERS